MLDSRSSLVIDFLHSSVYMSIKLINCLKPLNVGAVCDAAIVTLTRAVQWSRGNRGQFGGGERVNGRV